MAKAKQEVRTININPAPKGELKDLGGAKHDEWNYRLVNLVSSALPVKQDNLAQSNEAATAALSGMIELKPSDPVEAMLISQLIVAHEAALSLYRRAWLQPPEHFDAKTKYLQLADKSQRTVALLSERLDQHRGRGQQQIVVKHVTVNADQAVVADSVVTGKGAEAVPAAKQLASPADRPMEVLEIRPREAVTGGGEGQK